MKYFIGIILFTIQAGLSQELLESFDLDGLNRFKGKTSYQFELESDDLGERSLTINHVKGDIVVKGTVGSEIIIVETIIIKSLSRSKAQKLFENKKAKISRNPNSDHFLIEGVAMKSSKVNFDYTIELPSHFNLELHTSGGDIKCKNIVGAIQSQTSGGDIEFIGLYGKIVGKTSGGDITIEDSQGSLSVTTSGGDIEILRSEGIISSKTSGGDIEVENVNGKLTVYTSGGDIELSHIKGNRTEATTSGGDIEAEYLTGDLMAKTSGGSIEVYQLEGKLDATTSGGDIELKNIEGKINASTNGGSVSGEYISGSIRASSSGGDIDVLIIGHKNDQEHNISLDAKSGDIKLVLPANFPSSIDARVTGERSSRAIESEFPITIILDDNQVTGSGTIGNGNHIVILRAQNGRITIERN